MAVQTAIPVRMDAVFPFGAYVAGAVEPVRDFDAPAGPGVQRAQKHDKLTGLPMWAVPVIDGDETVRGPAKSVKVNVLAPHQPVPPEAVAVPGSPTACERPACARRPSRLLRSRHPPVELAPGRCELCPPAGAPSFITVLRP